MVKSQRAAFGERLGVNRAPALGLDLLAGPFCKDMLPANPRWGGRSEGFRPFPPSPGCLRAEEGGAVRPRAEPSWTTPAWGGARLLPAAIECVSPAPPPSSRPLSLQWEPRRRRRGRLRASLQAPLRRNLHRQLQPLPETNGCQEILGGSPREKV